MSAPRVQGSRSGRTRPVNGGQRLRKTAGRVDVDAWARRAGLGQLTDGYTSKRLDTEVKQRLLRGHPPAGWRVGNDHLAVLGWDEDPHHPPTEAHPGDRADPCVSAPYLISRSA
jgi:hypothetical protein